MFKFGQRIVDAFVVLNGRVQTTIICGALAIVTCTASFAGVVWWPQLMGGATPQLHAVWRASDASPATPSVTRSTLGPADADGSQVGDDTKRGAIPTPTTTPTVGTSGQPLPLSGTPTPSVPAATPSSETPSNPTNEPTVDPSPSPSGEPPAGGNNEEPPADGAEEPASNPLEDLLNPLLP